MRARPLSPSVLALLLLACGGPPPPVTAPPTAPASPAPAPSATPPVDAAPKAETVDADALRALAGGTHFLVPAGFTVTIDGGHAIVVAPERDLKVAVVETSAKTPDEAVAAAWPPLRADFKRPLKLASKRPGRRG